MTIVKIAQIIDKETKGLIYLENNKGEVINNALISSGPIVVFDVEIMEFEGENPLNYIEAREISVDLDNLNGKTIREVCEETL